MYYIKLNKQAKKFIEKQDKVLKQRIKRVLESLQLNPYPTNEELDIKKMINTQNYRLRIGKFRLLYFIENNELIIIIEKIDSRGDIYK